MNANELLRDLMAAWDVPPKEGGGLRMSSAGNRARRHAFDLGGYPQGQTTQRAQVTFATGDLLHDYLRDHLHERLEWAEVTDREREVVSTVHDIDIAGHIDAILRDKRTGERLLVDIKTMSHFTYVSLDPEVAGQPWYKQRNNKARNFAFDASRVLPGEPFARGYLYQLASYWAALTDDPPHGDGEELDGAFILCVNKNTGHLAIGTFDTATVPALLAERDWQWDAAINAESPYELPICREPTENKDGTLSPDIRCQYCPYIDVCLATESVAGIPKIYKGVLDSRPK